MFFGENVGGGGGAGGTLLGAWGEGLDVADEVGPGVGVVGVLEELDRRGSQGRHAKATAPINRMIAATLPRTTQACRDPVGGGLAGGLAADVLADLGGCGAA